MMAQSSSWRFVSTQVPEEGKATFDWTGTDPQTHGIFNSPMSLSYAAIIYSLRSTIRGAFFCESWRK